MLFSTANFNESWAIPELQNHIVLNFTDYKCNITLSAFENKTHLIDQPNLYNKAVEMMRNDSTPDSFADGFRQLYQQQVNSVFDARFFTNETFYKHPIVNDYEFFGYPVTYS